MGDVLVLLPVILPVLAAVPMLAWKRLEERRPRQIYLCAVLALNLLCALALIPLPAGSVDFLRFSERLAMTLRVDDAARFFCLLAAAMFLLVGVYALEYLAHEENERRFLFFYLIVLGLLGGIGLSANLLTLYFFFEIMSLCSMPLVLHSMTREAIGAAFKYLFYSIAGASMGLMGLFFVHACGGSLDFLPGGGLDRAALAGNEGAFRVVALLAIVGFGAKAGMFPLHAWLPTAHPAAPAPASAILSGVITKAGVFAIFRFVYYVVGADFLRGTWVQTAWMLLAIVTILMGSILAFKEPILKKRLAYSSVSQVSYIMLGLSTLTAGGVLGGLLHMVFHSLAKDAFFLIAGAVILCAGKTRVAALRGLGREMPRTLWLFTLVAVSMIGIPPAGGFLSKWYLAEGALTAGTGALAWIGPAALLFSALLTAGYLLPIPIRGFFPGRDFDGGGLQKREAAPVMTVPIAILAAAGLLLGMFPGGLTAFLQGIAEAVL